MRSAACKDKEEAAGRRRRLRTEFLLLLWRPLLKLLHGMVRSVGFRSGTIQGVIGCGDPACTGWIYAAQQSLGHVPLGRLHVEVVPSFTRVGFHGRVDVLLHLRPHQLLWALLRTGFEVGIRWLKSQRRRH